MSQKISKALSVVSLLSVTGTASHAATFTIQNALKGKSTPNTSYRLGNATTPTKAWGNFRIRIISHKPTIALLKDAEQSEIRDYLNQNFTTSEGLLQRSEFISKAFVPNPWKTSSSGNIWGGKYNLSQISDDTPLSGNELLVLVTATIFEGKDEHWREGPADEMQTGVPDDSATGSLVLKDESILFSKLVSSDSFIGKKRVIVRTGDIHYQASKPVFDIEIETE